MRETVEASEGPVAPGEPHNTRMRHRRTPSAPSRRTGRCRGAFGSGSCRSRGPAGACPTRDLLTKRGGGPVGSARSAAVLVGGPDALGNRADGSELSHFRDRLACGRGADHDICPRRFRSIRGAVRQIAPTRLSTVSVKARDRARAAASAAGVAAGTAPASIAATMIGKPERGTSSATFFPLDPSGRLRRALQAGRSTGAPNGCRPGGRRRRAGGISGAAPERGLPQREGRT
jgi:hypothetical protein